MHRLAWSLTTIRRPANASLRKGQQVHGAGLCVELKGEYFGAEQ